MKTRKEMERLESPIRGVLRKYFYVGFLCSASLSNCIAESLSLPPMIADRSFGLQLKQDFTAYQMSMKAGHISVGEAKLKMLNTLSMGYSDYGGRLKCEFPKGIHFNPTRDDIGKIVKNLFSGNSKNWHGYARELKLLNAIEHPESEFTLLSVGSQAKIQDGRVVELDAVFSHNKTGYKIAMEAKDWNIRSSQDMAKAKAQISKIASRVEQEGMEKAIWVNHKPVSSGFRSQLEAFAKKKGVGFYDNVTTGPMTAAKDSKTTLFDHILKKEAKGMQRVATGRVTRVNGKALGRVAGGVGVALEVGDFGYSVYQWRSGGVTTRELVSKGGGAVGGATGAWGGALAGVEAGAYIGSCFGPGPGTAIGAAIGGVVGTIGGAIGGNIAGSKASSYAADKMLFNKLAENERSDLLNFLKMHYTDNSFSGPVRPLSH